MPNPTPLGQPNPILNTLDLLTKANQPGETHMVDDDRRIGAPIRAVLHLDSRLSTVEVKTSQMM